MRFVTVCFFRLLSLSLRIFVKTCGLTNFFFLGRPTYFLNEKDLKEFTSCDGKHPEVDILISLFNFESYADIVIKSINSNLCPNNYFHLSFVQCSRNEADKLLQKIDKHAKLVVNVIGDRISLYKTWNNSIKIGTAELITNLNVDDLRRPKSICHFAKIMQFNADQDAIFGDVVVTTKSPIRNWSNLSIRYRKTRLGKFNLKSLVYFGNNKPHSAPMWRRKLHEELNFFREDLRSSGDAEFWLRCLVAGKKFMYHPEVSSVYFYNTSGLSSGWRSAGFKEWNTILLERYAQNKGLIVKISNWIRF